MAQNIRRFGRTSGSKESIRLGRTSGSQGLGSRFERQTPPDEVSDVMLFLSSDIKRATKGFNESLKIGKWRFGNVYKGNLDNIEVFIKTLDTKFDEGKDAFLKELNVLKEIRHPNLANLFGSCIELRTLVYELLPDKSLEDFLDNSPQLLTWQIRARIINQLCSALIFLYSNQPRPIFHGNINASFIFLDANLDIKVLIPGGSPSTNPNPKGKFTEYIEIGNRKLSIDVYRLGVTILGLLTGLSDSRIEGEVRDAHKEEWVKRNVDKKAGYWPFQLAKKLAFFGSKFCNNSSCPLSEIVEDLGMLSATIDDHTRKEKGVGFSPAVSDTVTNKAVRFEEDNEKSRPQRRGRSSGTQGSDSSTRRQTSTEISDVRLFSYSDIERATNGFSDSSRIGKWRFGSAYNGYLDNSKVFIKMLASEVKQSEDEYLQEVKVLKEISHPNLVKLVGACIQPRTLVYEILPDDTLEECLSRYPRRLTWQIRTRIICQLCSALIFLHSNKPCPIIHGNLKPSYIFCDPKFDIKVLLPGRTPSSNPNPKGRFTEYIETGNLKLSSDVYSFGVTVLRLVTGMTASRIEEEVHDAHRADWVKRNVDKTAGDWPFPQAKKFAYFGSKFCKDASVLAEEFLEDLDIILVGTDSFGSNEMSAYSNSKDEKETSSENYAAYNVQFEEEKKTSEIRGTTSRAVTPDVSKETSKFKVFLQSEVHAATNSLNEASRIGKGGYGSVYKGYLDNTEVAIKMLDSDSSQGLEEFMQEVDVLGEIRHPNLVRLVGACFKLRSLVYEFLPNGSLEDCLKKRPEVLTWQMRVRIIFEICSGLIFLHSQHQPMVHGDLKPDNILLDANFTAKLADFGLCRLLPEGSASATVAFHVTKNIKGTEWYIDPDFLESGKITPGCDVYAFGVTILRLLTGLSAANILRKVRRAYKQKKTMTIVDSTARDWPDEVGEYLAFVGLECCEEDRTCSKLMREMSLNLKDMLANKCT